MIEEKQPFLKSTDIARILQIGPERARRLAARIDGAVVIKGGGLLRRRTEVRVPPPAFERWCRENGGGR